MNAEDGRSAMLWAETVSSAVDRSWSTLAVLLAHLAPETDLEVASQASRGIGKRNCAARVVRLPRAMPRDYGLGRKGKKRR